MINVADLFEDDSDEKLLADDDFHPNQRGTLLWQIVYSPK